MYDSEDESHRGEEGCEDMAEANGSVCPVCSDDIEVYALGHCNHPICFRCSVRLRYLCNKSDCPICRSEVKHVAFVTAARLAKFETINLSSLCLDRKAMIFSESDEIRRRYLDMLRHECRFCEPPCEFETFSKLKMHVAKRHDLVGCSLCTDHLNLFSHERKFYSAAQMVAHRESGDPDDRSYRGHPMCEFCNKRYFDKDALHLHLRKDHFHCHFCEADGRSGEYYCTYDDLKQHFREEHYLCEEGECATAQWNNAFRSDIDLQGHQIKMHSKELDKTQLMKLKKVEMNFELFESLRKRNEARHRSRKPIPGKESAVDFVSNVSLPGHINLASREVIEVMRGQAMPSQQEEFFNDASLAEFPAISGGNTAASSTGNRPNFLVFSHKTQFGARPASLLGFPALPSKKRPSKPLKVSEKSTPHAQNYSQTLTLGSNWGQTSSGFTKAYNPPGRGTSNNQQRTVEHIPRMETKIINTSASLKETNSVSAATGFQAKQSKTPQAYRADKPSTVASLREAIPTQPANSSAATNDWSMIVSKSSAKKNKSKNNVALINYSSSNNNSNSYNNNSNSNNNNKAFMNEKENDESVGLSSQFKPLSIVPQVEAIEKRKVEKAQEQAKYQNMRQLTSSKSRQESADKSDFPSLPTMKKAINPLSVKRPKPAAVRQGTWSFAPEIGLQSKETPEERLSNTILSEKSQSALESLKSLLNQLNQGAKEPEEFYDSCVRLLSSSLLELAFKDISALVKSGKERSKLMAVHHKRLIGDLN